MPLELERLQWMGRRNVNGSHCNRDIDEQEPDSTNIEAPDEIHNDWDNDGSLLSLRNNLEWTCDSSNIVEHCGIRTCDADDSWPHRCPLSYSGHCCKADIWFLVHVVDLFVRNLVVRNLVQNLVVQAQGHSSDDRCSPTV